MTPYEVVLTVVAVLLLANSLHARSALRGERERADLADESAARYHAACTLALHLLTGYTLARERAAALIRNDALRLEVVEQFNDGVLNYAVDDVAAVMTGQDAAPDQLARLSRFVDSVPRHRF